MDLNFFDAGGSSLEAMQLLERLSTQYSRLLHPTFTFEHTTIRRQAAALEAMASSREAVSGRGRQRRDSQDRDTRRRD